MGCEAVQLNALLCVLVSQILIGTNMPTKEIHSKRIKVAQLALMKGQTLSSIAEFFKCTPSSISLMLHTFCRNSNRALYNKLLDQCVYTVKPSLASLVEYKHSFYTDKATVVIDKVKIFETKALEAASLVFLDGLTIIAASKQLNVSTTNIYKLLDTQ